MSKLPLTPKQEAEALFESMKGFRVKYSHSLKCAMITVDKILGYLEADGFPPEVEYWKEVKSELLIIKKQLK